MKKVLISSLFLLSIGSYAQDYCTPQFSSGCNSGDNIHSFSIPNIVFAHESTGCSDNAYGNFTEEVIVVQPTVSYPFSITHGYKNQKVKIWVDFNNDGAFDESSELIVSVASNNKETTGNIVIPVSVTPGNYRMRVATKYSTSNAYPTPCQNANSYGEAHDYTLQVNAPPTCFQPNNITISQLGSMDVACVWEVPSVNPNNGYEYYYTTSNAMPNENTMASGVATTNNMTITGLNSDTAYNLWVRSVCSSTDKSSWNGPLSFNTLCTPYASGYTQGFEDEEVPNLNQCWATKVEGASTQNYVMYTSQNASISNSKFFKMYNYTDVSGIYYLISPQFTDLDNNKEIVMDIYKDMNASDGNNTVEIGVMTNITDTSTYTMLKNIPLSNLVEGGWKEIAINTSNYTGGAGHIVFKYKPSTKYNAFYIDNFEYHDTPTCIKPSGLQVSSVDSTVATLSWVASNSNPSNGYEYYYSTSSVEPSSETQAIGTTNTNTTSLNTLTPNTNYYFWVRSACSDSDKSTWLGVASFRTRCSDYTATYNQSFDEFTAPNIDPCWSTKIDNSTYAYANISTYADNNLSTPNSIRMYNGTDVSGAYYLISPLFSDLNNNKQITMNVKDVAGTSLGSIEVGVMTNPLDINTYSTIDTVMLSELSPSAWEEITVNTTSYTGGQGHIVIKYKAREAYKPILIDNFKYEELPSCFKPNDVIASDISNDMFSISWTAPSNMPSGGYEYYYSTDANYPSESVTISGTSATNTVTIDELTESTMYYVWVRSFCDTTDKSQWSNVLQVTTLCNSQSLPYSENFDSAVVPNLPLCISRENFSTNQWEVASSGNIGGMSGNVMRYKWDKNSAANTWFYTKGLSLEAGKTYTLQFKYANTDTGSHVENLKVSLGTNPTASAMTTEIQNYPDIPIGSVDANISFTVPTTDVYYIGFQCYSAADQYYLYVDNLLIDEKVLATDEINIDNFNKVQVYPNPFKNVVNISNIKGVESISVVDMAGRTVKSLKPSKQLHLGDLNSGMYFINLSYKNSTTKTLKVVKK